MSRPLPMPFCSTEFFRFSHRPFRGTPDLEDYVAIDAIEQEVQRLAAAAANGDGIAVLTAVPGAGKTLVCQRLQAVLSDRFEAVLLSSSGFATRRALLQAVLFALAQSYESSSEQELRLSVLNYARTLCAARDGLVLIIDEAHVLNVRLLEELRCLTNHSQGGQPLIRIVLCGQLPLEDALVDPALEALNYRITCHATLEPLSMHESAQLIAGRLRRAGRDVKEIFTPEALETICRVSDGNPRCVVQLCDESLRIASGCSEVPVEVETVRQALYDLKQLPLQWNESAIDQPQTAAAASDATLADDVWLVPGTPSDGGHTPSSPASPASQSPLAASWETKADLAGDDGDLGWSAAVSSVELGADCDLCESPSAPAGWSSFEPQSGWEPSGAADACKRGEAIGNCDTTPPSCGSRDDMGSPAPLPRRGEHFSCWSDPMIDGLAEDGPIESSKIENGARAAKASTAAESQGRGFVELPVEDVYASLDAQKPPTPPPGATESFDLMLRSSATTASRDSRRTARKQIADAEPSQQHDIRPERSDDAGNLPIDPVKRIDAVMAALSAVTAETPAASATSRSQWQSAGDCREFDVLEPGGEPQWGSCPEVPSADASAAGAGLQLRARGDQSAATHEAPRNGQNGSTQHPVRRPYARLFSRVRRQQS
jgi:type II secretory pathway predicted ATPase ExeA